MLKKIIMILFITTVISISISADDTHVNVENTGVFLNGLARPAVWGKPFWADMHPTLIRTDVSMADNSSEYDWAKTEENFRPFLFANLGVDIPIWSGDFSNGKFGLNFTMPFIITVWLDVFEPVTAPVINTDYRAGAPSMAFIHRLDSPLELFSSLRIGLYNYSIKFSPFIHESTHIGDELTIYRKDENMDITRVNVSYNFSELVLTINDPDGSLKMNHAFRAGLMVNHNPKKGWYYIISQEADEKIIEMSQIPFEAYIQYQFQSGIFWQGFQFIFSGEMRLREKYNYPFSYPNHIANDAWLNEYLEDSPLLNPCFSFFTGIRYNNPQPDIFSRMGVGFRVYMGVNPYGQFRNQYFYRQFGIALLFEY